MRIVRTAIALVLGAVSIGAAPSRATSSTVDCQPWTVRTVADGLGSLENLEPDGTGGMLISASSRSAVERVAPDGSVTTVASDMESPGGLRVHGSTLFATTGVRPVSGLLDLRDGTVEVIDLRSGERRTYTDGLSMPNGLVREVDGDLYVSRTFGHDAHIARIPADDPNSPDTMWADLPDTNGLAIDPTQRWLYATTTFNAEAAVYRIRLDAPDTIERIAELGSATSPAKGLDDMTIARDGTLYIAANGAGQIIRLDPTTGESCIIAEGLRNPTSVKFGKGPGWSSHNLYVSGFDGRLLELESADARSR